jgi:hypothetical protein
MSRPRADQLALVERVALALRDDPGATANAVYQRVGGRRRDVLRAVRAIRAAALPLPTLNGRATRFPNAESGKCAGRSDPPNRVGA